MSGGSINNKRKEPLSDPHRHIGAQDLLKQKDSVSHSGFLRKRGKLERIVGSNGLFTALFSELAKWRQRFVIVGRGCLYVYADEHGRAPLQSVSLKHYARVERPTAGGLEIDTRRCFRVVPSNERAMKIFVFGCAKDGERKEWMYKIREEMLLANSKTEDAGASGLESDEYVYLEKPVIEQLTQAPSYGKPDVPRRKPPKPPGEEDSDDSSDYDKIPEEDLKKIRSKPLPKVPNEDNQVVRRPEKAKKPQHLNPRERTSDPNEYLFDNSDRQKAIDILSRRTSGTFLVRKSRMGDQQVLSVQTEEGMKEYKIYEKPGGLTIDNKTYFSTVEKLIDNYKRQTLPNRRTTLMRGFSIAEEK